MIKKLLRNYYFLLILSILYILVFNLSSYNYFIQDFLLLEKQENKKVVSQVIKKIDDKLHSLRSITRDYALWDDTYAYIQNKNPDFIYENFRASTNTLEDLKLAFVLFTDLNNNVAFMKYANNVDKKVYPEILKNISKQNLSTIKKIHDEYYYITKASILRSDEKGKPKGYLYFAKKFDLEELNNKFFSINIINKTIKPKDTTFKSNFIKRIFANSLYTDNFLRNIIYFQNENLKKIFALEIVTKRDIYNQGKKNILFFNSVISVFFLILFFIFYWNISYQSKLNNKLQKKVEEEISKQREQEQLLIQQSKLAAMGEMIGNIAHQWRQPLNALGLVIQNIQFTHAIGELDDEFMAKSVNKANILTANMSKTIDDFRNFFKPNKHKEVFGLTPFLEKTLFLIESTLNFHKIEVIKNYNEESLYIYNFSNEFSQVILNILTNAKDALISNEIANPKIKITTSLKNNFIQIKIKDNAGGIKEELLEKIFEPYFTTKEEGKGTGIGLYMSKTIVENNMNGYLTVQTDKKGSVFIIEIPQAEKED